MSEAATIDSTKPFANYVGPLDASGKQCGDMGWRVSITFQGRQFIISPLWEVHPVESNFHFASQRDAELAAKALITAGLDTPEKLIDAGWGQVKRTMCESLPW
jgi:hypothetical protein